MKGILPVAIITVLSVATRAGAQSPARSCTGDAHRQFDFWLGEWTVIDAEGRPAGTSVIQATLDGCAITEAFQSGPMRGTSVNFYDAARTRWHQTWIDNLGRALYLEGGLANGVMLLEGDRQGSDGRVSRQRIGWSRLPDGHVRQLWESSNDSGRTWATVFDGRYIPRRTQMPTPPGDVDGPLGPATMVNQGVGNVRRLTGA